jgi:hypothetical protein
MPNEMKEVVICRECGKEEYYGMMIWYNGRTYCRAVHIAMEKKSEI